MCNGSGDCRKASGVMCPSFQATREEEHSTRGRANLLRAALSGQLGAEAWTDPAVDDALDLCLGCKACKTECPSSVDMAKIKAEVLAQRYARKGVPLRARLFGHIHTINQLAAPVAPLANADAAHLVCPRPGPASDRTAPGAFSAALCQSYVHRVVCAQNSDGAESDRAKQAGGAVSRTPSRPSTIRKSG